MPQKHPNHAGNAPSVRARHLQQWLQLVAREPDPWRATFAALVPAKSRETIEGAIPTLWLPAGLHAELADVLHEAFGPARAHDYYRRSMLPSLRGPLFGPLLRTGLTLLGATPASLLRWASKGWDVSFRDCGVLRGELRGEGYGRLVYESLPEVLTRSDAWVDSATGSAYGALDTIGARGVVRLDKRRLGEGAMVLEIEWET